jgi:protein-tyrosine phosphatase
MVALGIKRIVTTPHLDGSLSLDRVAWAERLTVMDAAWESALEAVRRSYPDVDLRRGHEVMLDIPDVDLGDPRLRLAGTSFVLIEWPRLRLPPSTGRVIRRIVSEGHRPIVAHPERYVGIARSLASVIEWREAGAYLQVNYGSLVGKYGGRARVAALGLLRRGWVDYLASDFHARAGLSIELDEARSRLQGLGGTEALSLLCVVNPGRILDDEAPLPVPLLPPESGVFDRMLGLLRPGPE